jgi:adenylate cyclase class IV
VQVDGSYSTCTNDGTCVMAIVQRVRNLQLNWEYVNTSMFKKSRTLKTISFTSATMVTKQRSRYKKPKFVLLLRRLLPKMK